MALSSRSTDRNELCGFSNESWEVEDLQESLLYGLPEGEDEIMDDELKTCTNLEIVTAEQFVIFVRAHPG